jgi:hypothetical protein
MGKKLWIKNYVTQFTKNFKLVGVKRFFVVVGVFVVVAFPSFRGKPCLIYFDVVSIRFFFNSIDFLFSGIFSSITFILEIGCERKFLFAFTTRIHFFSLFEVNETTFYSQEKEKEKLVDTWDYDIYIRVTEFEMFFLIFMAATCDWHTLDPY